MVASYVLQLVLLSIILCRVCLSQTKAPNSDKVRIPLYITPLKSIPQPKHLTSRFYQDDRKDDFFSKVTMADIYEYNYNLTIDDIRNSSVYHIFELANQLYDDGFLNSTYLYYYNCSDVCYDLDLDKINYVTESNSSYLSGNTFVPIKIGDLHNRIVETLEYYFCFTMDNVESTVNGSSFDVYEDTWMEYVEEIASSALRCRSDILGITMSEMAELARQDEDEILQYNLYQLEHEFISVYENVIQSVSSLHNKTLIRSDDFDHPLINYVDSVTGFTNRDIVILYHLDEPQGYALNISLQSFLYCEEIKVGITLHTLLRKSLAIETDCDVAIILSRSIKFVQSFYSNIPNVLNLSILDIFARATSINSWENASSILQITNGLYYDAQRLSDIIKYGVGVRKSDIMSSSVPDIIATYLSDSDTELLAKDYPAIISKMLSTYGFTTNSLAKATLLTVDQLVQESVASLHSTILNILADRYHLRDDILMKFSANAEVSSLPSSEWPGIVATYKNESFQAIMVAFFGDLLKTPDGISIEVLNDNFQSVHTTDKLMTSSFAYEIDDFASCLFPNLDLTNINISNYHSFYNRTLADKIKKKITFETTNLQSILINLQKVFEDILSEKVSDSVELTKNDLRCIYGTDIAKAVDLTWNIVKQNKICEPFLERSILDIMIEVTTSSIITCNVDECVSSPCHDLAICSPGPMAICTCMSGYTGDGVSRCRDIDECGQNVCPSGTSCFNTQGSYACGCDIGYYSSGNICIDIDECLTNPCESTGSSVCSNVPGTFSCACKTGFIGNGFSCEDTDECLTKPCDPNGFSICSNVPGTFSCACKTGFIGNGFSCEDDDECELFPCHTNATCTNQPGSYTCKCNAGFSGNGKLCTENLGDSEKSSSSNVAVVVGATIGGGVLLVILFILLIVFLMRRKSTRRRSPHKANNTNDNAVVNKAYGLDQYNKRSSQGDRDPPEHYTSLDNTRREPAVVENYETLRQPGSNENYEQLNNANRDPPDSNHTYAHLTSSNVTSSPYNSPESAIDTNITSEPIYEELP